jgi:hypothetical protein
MRRAATSLMGQLRTHALQQTRVIAVGGIVTPSFFAALQNILILCSKIKAGLDFLCPAARNYALGWVR